jgi:signal transduction histidine kinase
MLTFDSGINDVLVLYVGTAADNPKITLKNLVKEVKHFHSIEDVYKYYSENVNNEPKMIVMLSIQYKINFDYDDYFQKISILNNDTPLIVVIPESKVILKYIISYSIDNFILSPIDSDVLIDKINKMANNIEQRLELKALNQENVRKDEMLLKQSRLAIMGEMISMIAHQWRQPLNSINGVVMAMNMHRQMDTLSDDKFNEHLDNIKDTTKFLTNTINDFRKFFNKDKELSKFYPKDIIDKVLALISHRINQDKLEIIQNCDFEDFIVNYESELQQVILNILNNAMDEFEIKKIKNPVLKICLRKDTTRNSVKIIITDNAGGIPLDVMPKIFDPYFSTKSKNGTGLGLYMSKMIVHDSLNGHLFVENDDDGATFTVEIPLENSIITTCSIMPKESENEL